MPRLLRQLTLLKDRRAEGSPTLLLPMAAADETHHGNCQPIFPGLDEDEAALASDELF